MIEELPPAPLPAAGGLYIRATPAAEPELIERTGPVAVLTVSPESPTNDAEVE